MQRILLLRSQTILTLGVLTAMIALAITPFQGVRAQASQLANPPANQVAVKLKSGVSINTILARYQAAALGQITETNLYFLQLPAGETATQILPAMNADPDLWYAEPNYYVDGSPNSSYIMFGSTYIMFGSTGGLTPTAQGMSDQWAWTQIGLADAQKISTGQGIIVAVLDTGLTPDHPLLASSITAGYDFVDMNNSISDVGNGLDDDGNGQIDEAVGHGTHVSGIIETEAPGVQIMPIRVLNSDGVGTYWEVAAGIRYAVDHGAKVINMSMSAPRLTASLSSALAYAQSHGVIVVAAAGTGAGPNYPAGYPDKLGVIGVGASDQNDAVASFSGGLPGDTDLFAPGVRIYSAYAYNGYAYGSGTSMSAPIVAAEAALMISRHPDWSYNELLQRIVSSTAPVAGASVGRINLSGALSTGLEVDHSSPNLSPLPSDAYLTPRLKLFNNTPQDIPLSSLTVRYWYTEEGTTPQTFWCDYSTPVACSNLTGTFVQIPANSANRTATSDSYLQVGFSSSAGVLPGGGVIDTYLRVFKTDISNYNELNDYSYDDPTKPDMSRWNRITIYQNGALVWGIEPNASQPTPTSPPTVVNQPTVTPLPASTNTNTAFPTMTRTGTPVPPTGTATRTSTPATRTNTPVLVTATATVTRTSAPATATASPTATMTRTSAPATATASPTATMTRTNTPVPPSVTPTSVPAATASKTPTPAAAGLACTVTYSNASDWGSGYSGNVAITNNGAAAISGWTLTWTFPGNQSITSLWGGSYTQSGTNVSITDAGYNATLAANGGSTSVGFNANYSGTNAKPATFSLNGTICQ